MRLIPKNGQVVLKMDPAPETTSSGLYIAEEARTARVGTVVAAEGWTGLIEGDKVVCSAVKDSFVEVDGYRLQHVDYVYSLHPFEAFHQRLILLLDAKGETMLSERAEKRILLAGGKADLRTATVLSSGLPEFSEGDRVGVRPDIYDCLQVLPHDKDLPDSNVPEGQEIRLYKPCPSEGAKAIYRQVPVKL